MEQTLNFEMTKDEATQLSTALEQLSKVLAEALDADKEKQSSFRH